MQMLEETNRHFVYCKATNGDPDPRVARELSPLICKQGEASEQWIAKFVDQQTSWFDDLDALVVCTGSEHRGR